MPMQSARHRAALAVGALVMVTFLSPLGVSAHHGWGGYVEEISEITGTVDTPVSLAGPHATLKVRVDSQVWDVVLAPPAGTARSGLKEGMIPVGAKVIVHGQRHSDPKKFEMKTTQLTWNGRVFKVYPDRD